MIQDMGDCTPHSAGVANNPANLLNEGADTTEFPKKGEHLKPRIIDALKKFELMNPECGANFVWGGIRQRSRRHEMSREFR
jgi:hypothetical protein